MTTPEQNISAMRNAVKAEYERARDEFRYIVMQVGIPEEKRLEVLHKYNRASDAYYKADLEHLRNLKEINELSERCKLDFERGDCREHGRVSLL